ncbi:hypothetical protein Dshi_1558 [Dinoroseobacter shibae DFL 12 = DSM 16493]|jgi:hypothetical protein|uniref:Uncharacterized protein n=1 Tax=Dinoroseobacter shibae (strain DSM 16493 / NCIMB 14021 / DFL 12) TaxID=398580 RepID=A8LKT6_DINSH|nr:MULTISPECIES: hypothetical protein [Dinoroseobacter]ABV93300.1 hypothetical protein Dshi_1558 [Dinoroseobacter shibae DFL 12 = DSM 16493]MDD9715609.1 hypothetical protein [Dinoroseobacter sp. PD6]URF48220.1 hypothetical protein M8008_08035 [Dinoroseobacter shibae]URF52530.1 hypothetical protein M8007_08035 [Dinoroseobacter shibae]
MPRSQTPILTAALCVLAAPAFASGPGETHHGGTAFLPNGVLTYALFESTIEHVDLASCPAQFDPEVVFCRMTLASDLAHVFAFRYDGEQPLLAIKSYELDDEFLPF